MKRFLLTTGCCAILISGLSAVSPCSAELATTTDAKFKKDVLTAKEPVFIDFYATWCVPCKRMEPEVQSLATKYKGKIKFLRVDVDKNEKLAKKLAIDFLPTFMTFKNGKKVDTLSGLLEPSELAGKCDSLIK